MSSPFSHPVFPVEVWCAANSLTANHITSELNGKTETKDTKTGTIESGIVALDAFR